MNTIVVKKANPCYPKSEGLVIPANTKGSMLKGIAARVSKDGMGSISKEAKAFVSTNRVEVGTCFSTGPGRLKRRGLQKIYHAVIKRLQSDFTSVFDVQKALDSAFKEALKDEISSVTVCGLGIDPGELDKKAVAYITWDISNRYSHLIEVKIIDDNEEFINEINKFVTRE